MAGHHDRDMQERATGWMRSSPSPLRGTNILRRLGTLKSPISPIKQTISNSRARGNHYASLDEAGAEGDAVGIDPLSLSGLGYQLTDTSDSGNGPQESMDSSTRNKSHGSEDLQLDKSRSSSTRLGDGMAVGAQLQRSVSSRSCSNGKAVDELGRSKSIRECGQGLAQRRQVIVAVDEPIDVSSYDGAQLRRFSSHQSANTIDVKRVLPNTTQQSYYYPDDPEHPNWKPFPMRRAWILFLTLISLGLAGAQEWLYRNSFALAKDNTGILSFNTVTEVPLWNFFCWKYLPTLIFVVYGVLWSVMDYQIKRLEPYYQLSQSCGSTAAASLNLDHNTIWSYFVPFKALRLKQWAVLFSSLGSIFATSIAPSLQNPSVIFVQNPCFPNCKHDEKRYIVTIAAGWSRALTTSLVITAVFGTILLIQLRRKSGLLSDPRGIAGIASMATKSHILNDFQGMDLATHRDIHRRLRHRRYVLCKSSIWQGEYDRCGDPVPSQSDKLENPHPIMLRLQAGIPFIGIMVFCFFAIPVINFTPLRAIPNTLPWLPVLVATLIKIAWSTLEFDVKSIEPFYFLSKGKAPPEKSLTLDYRGTVYGWFPIKAMLNGHYLLALVGASSILLDLLTITVASFSVNAEGFLHPVRNANSSEQTETFTSFWASVAISLAILSFVIFSASLVYLRRRHAFLPRQPSTIAAVLAFIHASKMLYDFVDTERMNNKAMETRLKSIGKTYGLGWFRGRDGQLHCAIDEEPMRSQYVHGKPYTLAAEPWQQGGDHQL